MTSVYEESSRLVLLKGKRTKRQRSASPLVAVSSVSSVETKQEEEEEACEVEFGSGATDEDQDMANCLMLLSQGHKASFFSYKKPISSLGLGFDSVYQCKTCDKSFHSFQALGGHRASHKKPKLEMISASPVESGVVGNFLSLQVTSRDNSKIKSEKTHECSICKAEFSSGQALGGHMRRHRGLTLNANANATSTIKTAISSIRPKNLLELDLNLPAPEDEPKFTFASKDQILRFTSNSLIDCHH